MFSFFRRVFRPIGFIGQKLKNIFRIGKKAEVVREVRNVVPDAIRVPNYGPDHIDYATKYKDIWGQNIIRD
jgi:hypothetical protein